MWMAIWIGLSILIIAGASFILVVSIRGKLRPGFGRSWKIQNAVFAVGQYFMALTFLCLSQVWGKGHPFDLSWFQLIGIGVIGIALAFMCWFFYAYVLVLRMYRSSGRDIRLPHWMYGWFFDEDDTLGQQRARANGATETGDAL